MNSYVLLTLTFNHTNISTFYETRTLLGTLLLNREIKIANVRFRSETGCGVLLRFPVDRGVMLRNIFPVEKALRKLNASHGITAHDDLVSIICVENESIEKSILFQSLVTNNRDGYCVVYVAKEPFDVLPEPVEDMPSADPLYMDAVTFM